MFVIRRLGHKVLTKDRPLYRRRMTPMTTAKKRKTSRSREILSRHGLIEGWDLSLYARAQGGRAVEGRTRDESTYLKVRGTLTEAVNGVLSFDFQLTGSTSPMVGRPDIPSVGAITGMKPALQAGIDLSSEQFNTLLSIACAGRLKSCHFSFQTPHYGSALISSVSFSTSLPED